MSSVLWQKKTSFGLENTEQTLRGGLDGERLTKKTSFGLENIEQTLRGVLMEKEKSNC